MNFLISTGTRIRTLINGFGDRYSTIELCPYKASFKLLRQLTEGSKEAKIVKNYL